MNTRMIMILNYDRGREGCVEREGTGKEEGGKLRERVREGGGERGQASICA